MAEEQDLKLQDRRVERLVDLLEFEVGRIRSEQRRPGWTTWALLAAVATAGWLILSELDSQHVELSRVLFVSLVLFLLYDLIQLLVSVSAASPVREASDPRFRITRVLFSQSRLSMILDFTRYVALLLIAATNPLLTSGPARHVLYVYCSLMILSAALGMTLSFVDIPIPTSRPRQPIADVVLLLIYLALVMSTVGVIWRLASVGSSVTIPEIRVAALVVAGLVCLSVLTRSHREFPFLSTLEDIRRRLGLDRIDYEGAKRQTEIALEGLGVSDLLQREADLILGRIRQLAGAERDSLQELRSLLSTLPDDLRNISDEKAALIDVVTRSVKSRNAEAQRSWESVKPALNRMKMKIALLSSFPPSYPDISSFLDRLEAEIDHTGELIKPQAIEIEQLLKRVNPPKSELTYEKK
jgi:hypothetical protein